MTCRIRGAALVFTILVLGGLAVPASTAAQDPAPQGAQAADSGSRFGLGFQSSWPAYGLSGLYDLNDRITAQAVLGAFGTVTTLSGRGLYHFSRQPKYSVFGFGTVGLWRYGYSVLGVDESESTVGVGGGAGVELNWSSIFDDGDGSFPPLYSTIDLGVTVASFDAYNWNAFGFGVGLHYRF